MFGALGSLKTWCCVHKTVCFLKLKSENFLGLRFSFFLVSCLYNFLVVSGSYKFWALRFIFFGRPFSNIVVVLHKTFGVLRSRAQGPLFLMKQTL